MKAKKLHNLFIRSKPSPGSYEIFILCFFVVVVCFIFSDCVYDLCAESGNTLLRCISLEAYAVACQEAGVKLGAWRQGLNCGTCDMSFCVSAASLCLNYLGLCIVMMPLGRFFRSQFDSTLNESIRYSFISSITAFIFTIKSHQAGQIEPPSGPKWNELNVTPQENIILAIPNSCNTVQVVSNLQIQATRNTRT